MPESAPHRQTKIAWSPRVAGIILLAAASCFAAGKPKSPPKPTADDCLTCHGDSGLSTERNGKTVSLFVNPDKFKASIHGAMFTCVDCHTDLKASPHDGQPAKVNCATCHADQQAAYDRSFHAKAIAAGDNKAATCVDCHGSPHELLPASDPNSRVSHLNIHKTCGSCHGSQHGRGGFKLSLFGFDSAFDYLQIVQSNEGRRIVPSDPERSFMTDC